MIRINKVFLIGRITQEPELRHTTNGTPVCQINVAVNRPRQKDKEQEADFINVIIWDKQGENIAKYQSKGNQIAIEGKLQTGKYKDKDGKTIYKTEIIATSVQFIDNAKKDAKPEENAPKEEIRRADEVDPYQTFGDSIEAPVDLPF